MVGDIFQPTHLLFVLVVALLVLGPKRLPEVARTLGKGIRDFRGAISGDGDDGHLSFLAQDHSAPAAPAPVPSEAPTAAAPAPESPAASDHLGAPESSSASDPLGAPESPSASGPLGASETLAAPVTPATTTPDPEPATDPQPAVPAPAVTPATTTPAPDEQPAPAAHGDDAPATAVHPAGARPEQRD